MADLNTLLSKFLAALPRIPVTAAPAPVLFLRKTSGTANGADTNFVFDTPTDSAGNTTIPAGLLAKNGDTILVKYHVTFSSATSSKTYSVNIGHTATGVGGFTGGATLQTSGTTTASASVHIEAYLTRTSAGNQIAGGTTNVNGTSNQGTTQFTATLDETTALKVAVGVKDGTGNAAAVTIDWIEVWFIPSP